MVPLELKEKLSFHSENSWATSMWREMAIHRRRKMHQHQPKRRQNLGISPGGFQRLLHLAHQPSEQ